MIYSRFDSRIPFYILIFLSVCYVLSIVLLQFFCAVLAVLWILEKNSEKKKAINFFVIGISAFGIIRLISIIFSEYPEISIPALYKEALFYLSVFSFGFYFKVLDFKLVKLIIYAFLGGAAFNALIGVIKFNFGFVERAESFSSGYMVFSMYLLVALGIALISFELSENKRKYLYLNSVIILILAGIITSLGRANIFVAVLLLIMSLIIRKKVNIKQIVSFAIVIAAILYISFSSNPTLVKQRIGAPAAFSDRDIIYKGAVEIFPEHPVLGYGPRTFKKIFPHKEQFADQGIGSWHNQILQIYFESGILGLSAYLVLMFLIFQKGYKFLKTKPQQESRNIVLGVLLSVAALFLSSFFSNFIDSPVLSIEFAFIVSLMTSEIFRNKNALPVYHNV